MKCSTCGQNPDARLVYNEPISYYEADGHLVNTNIWGFIEYGTRGNLTKYLIEEEGCYDIQWRPRENGE